MDEREHWHLTHTRAKIPAPTVSTEEETEMSGDPPMEIPGSSEHEQYEHEMAKLGWQRWPSVDKQCWYWWWNEDPDGVPVPVSVMYSGQDKNYFASEGQLGWNRFQLVEEMEGWWKKLIEPATVGHPGWP